VSWRTIRDRQRGYAGVFNEPLIASTALRS
jgi:hypothetical protein